MPWTKRTLVNVTYGPSAPPSPATNDVWIDTDTSPWSRWQWNGSAWVTHTGVGLQALNKEFGESLQDALINAEAHVGTTAPSNPLEGREWWDTSADANNPTPKVFYSGAWHTFTSSAAVPDASTTTKGLSKTATAPDVASNPIVVGTNDPRVPLQGENDALQGTNGTPSASNPFLTDTDPRNTNARTPTSHAASHQGGSDALAVDAAAGTGSFRTLGTGALQAAAGNHAHSGAAITSGTVGVAFVGTGTKNSSTFYRGDGTFAVPPTGGGGAIDSNGDLIVGDSALDSNGDLVITTT